MALVVVTCWQNLRVIEPCLLLLFGAGLAGVFLF
jgi:hypothetical protein